MAGQIYFGIDENYDIPKESIAKYILNNLKKNNCSHSILVDAASGKEFTSKTIIENSIKFCKILKLHNIELNDVVSVISENDASYLFLFLGTLLNGSIFNPLNPTYYKAELKHALSLTKPKLVISSSSALKTITELLPELDFIKYVFTIGEVSDISEYQLNSIENHLKLTEEDIDKFEAENKFDPAEQGAIILSSSGTTGLPKGVLLTHINLRQIIGYIGHKDLFNANHQTSLQVLPYFHIYGIVILLSTIGNNLKVILLKKFIPQSFLESIEKYKVRLLFAVPPMLNFLTKNSLVNNFDLSSLMDVIVGAAPTALELQKELSTKFPNIKVREFYGLTEMSGAITVQTYKFSKPESAGRLIPGVSAKVVDTETHERVGPFKLGELCFKGHQLMKKYIENEIATKECIDNEGFLHSGDLGYCDNDGFFFVVDRIKELIKYKGFQVAPAELEALIISHPQIKDCGVVGIPDERAGEVPLAFVVKQLNATLTEENIVDFVAERISIQKRLYGGVKFIDEIPKNSSGKILRRQLKEYIKNIQST